MPTELSKRKKLLSIGGTAIVALLLFYFGFNFLKGTNIFERTTAYYVTFENLKDVTKSTPVSMDGYRIGLVRNLKFDYEGLKGVTAELALDRNVRIPVGSKVIIKGNPLSGAELAIAKPKVYSDFHKPEDTLVAFSSGDLMSQVSDDLLPAIAGLLNKMDTMLYSFDNLINNPNIHTVFREVAAASENLNASTRAMRAIMTNKVPAIVGNVETLSNNVSSLSDRLVRADIDSVALRLNRVLLETEALSRRFNSKDNSLGLLLNDKTLFESVYKATRSADTLLMDLKQNPKRYVHFSIF
ncbi:MlaD family protein [Porphyromonas sp.]|uniref:MlaD family protein n=1 Tax=Porphyromonas sp. TaxID=1924944 RepID=UPI0026DB419F|nr:MlaD family protein [Porphyromonas sp.]MDO4695896.1 MlaD family protein [Porphyromonas sp.]MDO4771850.1 MlaD family protein [Porphyromonas sp.]